MSARRPPLVPCLYCGLDIPLAWKTLTADLDGALLVYTMCDDCLSSNSSDVFDAAGKLKKVPRGWFKRDKARRDRFLRKHLTGPRAARRPRSRRQRDGAREEEGGSMSARDLEINAVTLDTLTSAIEQLETAGHGVSMLPIGGVPTILTLAEPGERRSAIATRIGDTRTALLGLRGILSRQRETLT